MNEELQSANEELQTSKEELQSVNEELETVNSELNTKVDELDHANSDLQNLLQATPVPTIFLDNALCIKKYTPAATALFPLIESDVGRPISDISTHFVDGDLVLQIREVLRSLATVERQVRLAERKEWYIMRITPYRTLDQVIEGVVLTFLDITDLLTSQAQAAELKSIVDSSSEAVIVKTLDDTITSWNRGAELIFGWSAEEAIGKKASVLLPSDLEAELTQQLRSMRSGQADQAPIDSVRLRKDGSRMDVSLATTVLKDRQGEIMLVAHFARDVTRSKDHERELLTANQALQRANEDLQQLTYATSHDLQEPLRMISNYSQLLTKTYSGQLDQAGRMYLENIQNGAMRLDGLLRAMHAYWNADHAINPSERVDSGRRAAQPQAHDRFRSCRCPPRSPAGRGGVGNAAPAALAEPAGQRAEVHPRRCDAHDPCQCLAREQSMGVLGGGQRHGRATALPPADLPAVQAPARERHQRSGHGPRDLQPHRAPLRRPDLGRGRRRRGHLQVHLASSGCTMKTIRPLRIVLIEDNHADAYVIEQALRQHEIEYELLRLDNGDDAVRHLCARSGEAGEPPDVILLDLHIPRLDGLEVLNAIRGEPALDGVPIAILTGAARTTLGKADLRGVRHFIHKSMNVDDYLHDVGHAVLEMRSAVTKRSRSG